MSDSTKNENNEIQYQTLFGKTDDFTTLNLMHAYLLGDEDTSLLNSMEYNFSRGLRREKYKFDKSKTRFIKEVNSFLAPDSIFKLYYNTIGTELQNLHVLLGYGSNIEEIRNTVCNFTDIPVSINIGNNTSITHGVRFVVEQPENNITINIGDRVFVGMNTEIYGGVNIDSGEEENGTSIGYGAELLSGCKIGKRVIICDGATIQEGVNIPDDHIVLSGLNIDSYHSKNIISVNKFISLEPNHKRDFRGLINIKNKTDKDLLLKDDSVYGFLKTLNNTVISENHLFPIMYKLVKRYHPEYYNIIHMSHCGLLINLDLPVDHMAFFMHYYNETKKKFENDHHKVQKYGGEFTAIKIEKSVRIYGTMYNIGKTNIKGNTEIHGTVVNRSGDLGGDLEINNCMIYDGVVFHAKGKKSLKNSKIKSSSIIHGKVSIQDATIGTDVIIHNSSIWGSSNTIIPTIIGYNSTVVNTNLVDSRLAQHVNLTGHGGTIHITNSNIGGKTWIGSKCNIINKIIKGNIRIPKQENLAGLNNS